MIDELFNVHSKLTGNQLSLLHIAKRQNIIICNTRHICN